jgi:hypothetical protein
MGKKKGRGKKTREPEKKDRKAIFWVVGLGVVVIAILVVSGIIPLQSSDIAVKRGKSFTVNGEETLPVLDPTMFMGQARAAYEAAKKYPEVLNQVFCYCFCDAEPFNHKSLLSCFTDKHGAG